VVKALKEKSRVDEDFMEFLRVAFEKLAVKKVSDEGVSGRKLENFY